MNSNSRQRLVVAIAMLVLAFTVIYAPFQINGRSLGYGWIFDRPLQVSTIDTGQLLIEWAAILLVVSPLVWILGRTDTFSLSGVADLALRVLVIVLRVIRGACGLLLGWQAIGIVLSVLTLLANPSGATGPPVGNIIFKLLVATVLLAIFVPLRLFVNWLHRERCDGAELLIRSRWSF